MKRVSSVLILLLGLLPFALLAEVPEGAAEAEFAASATEERPGRSPAYAEASEALKEARMHMGNAASARERVARLEDILDSYPDYPLRADLFYFLGINYQVLKQYDRAVAAFEAALQAEPDIAKETPIVSYLNAARRQTFADRTATVLIVLLVVSLALSIGRLARPEAEAVRWRRFAVVFGAALVVWCAVGLGLPALLGQPATGLENYPKPMLLNFRVGQLGDAVLRMLLFYGAGAIAAALPVVAAASTVKCPLRRRVLGTVGVLLATGSIMGLYGVRYCYGRCQYDAGHARLLFLVKDIASKEDVPDAMLPLYDETFRQRILDTRKQTGE